jgi:hypothetical protein
MQNDKALRVHVVNLLTKTEAHADFDAAVKGLPAKLRGEKPKGAEHSPWQVLEHLRIAQCDLIEYAVNPKHVSPEFPAGYWPKEAAPASGAAWDKSVEGFRKDRQRLCELVMDDKTDLLAKIPYAGGQTLLRQTLVTADHNAYHVGQLVLLRRMLGAWG